MSYYQLPRINHKITSDNIRLKFETDDNQALISKSLSNYLNLVKQQITNYINEWDDVKKITNPYEYIHTNMPHTKCAISQIKPISRSFFKMIEICNVFRIFHYFSPDPIKSYHLAEGPGGFIEAFAHLRNNPKDLYYGMTLMDPNNNKVPGWKKAQIFLNKHKNVHIETGKDGTGNLYKPCNLEYCMAKYQNSMNIITADGGFDFSIAFDKQENLALRLIFSQIMFALTMQKYKGHFILKVFDIFLRPTVELIYLLSCFYERIYIIKPHTSRYANSEKYIICKYFKYENTKEISKKFLSVSYVLDKLDWKIYNISSIINIPIQYYFLNQLTEYNAIFGQQQIENIIKTMSLIERNSVHREYLLQSKNSNIQKCIQWCLKNNISYNKNICPRNIFLGSLNNK
jgi:23S rRNA U2552 (ribose-2'-O)-methylase RlmE/FtsJ